MTTNGRRSAVTVTCADCDYVEAFDGLRRGREAAAVHESETGHAADFEISRLAPGVERAGADAGVCGRRGCENPDTPLLDHGSELTHPSEEESDPDA